MVKILFIGNLDVSDLSLGMNFFRIMSFLFAAVCINAAHATPPRYVELYDIAVAANKSHLFLFRHLSDNHGSHFKQTITRFLISQNINTGEVDGHWPIGKVFQDNSDECKNNCIEFGTKTQINPFDILAENEAIPFAPWPQTVWADGNPFPLSGGAYFLGENGLIENSEEQKIVLRTDEILTRVSASIDSTMALMPDEIKVVDPIEYDTNSYQHRLEGCIAEQITAGFRDHALFLLACESEGDNLINRFRVYFTVPNAKISD